MSIMLRILIVLSLAMGVFLQGAPGLQVRLVTSNQIELEVTEAGGKRFHLQGRSGANEDASWINIDGSHSDNGGTNWILLSTHLGLGSLYRIKTEGPENNGGAVFDESRVAIIKFTVDPTNYPTLTNIVGGTTSLANNDGEYVPADMDFDGIRIKNVGLRRKGNSSATRSASTNPNYIPWKVDFNRYVESQKFKGLTKLNLHIASSNGGGSGIEDYLGYGVYRGFGYPSPRTGWAEVWLNGEFAGLYTSVEQLDAQFLKRWFDKTDGNLYKPESPAGTLEWRGKTFSSYTNANWDRGNDTNHLAFLHFVDVINNKTVLEYPQAMDLNGVLTYLAGNIAIGAWDNYTTLSHNYYLYEASSNRMTMLPWDMNDSMSAGTNLWQSAGLGGAGGGGGIPGGQNTNSIPGGMTNGFPPWMTNSVPPWMTNAMPPGMTNAMPPGMTNALPSVIGGGSHPLSATLLSTNSPYRLNYLSILRAFLVGPGSVESLGKRIDTAVGVLSNRLDDARIGALRTNIATRVTALLPQLEATELQLRK